MGLKVYIEEKLEKRFRKLAMEIYGYGKGSLSLAVEDAISRWLLEHESILKEVEVPEDPVSTMRGLLNHVKKSGVELEHEARDIRAEKGGPTCIS
jgi:hypothetical protein